MRTIITQCTTPGMLALTYDDGPYSFTSQLLDTLDQLSVKVTFFITGNNLGKGEIDGCSTGWSAILQRMYSSGHQLAHHTWTHQDFSVVNTTIMQSEMIYNEMAFRNIFGWFPTYMRPPYLDCPSSCLSLMSSLGYHVITTDLDTKDYENDSPTLIQNSKDRFSAGLSNTSSSNSYIDLAHDIHYQTVVNLTAYMVSTAKQRGYQLVTFEFEFRLRQRYGHFSKLRVSFQHGYHDTWRDYVNGNDYGEHQQQCDRLVHKGHDHGNNHHRLHI
ncbi:polysaccharide deacetylase [Purpureocillium lavendulum]|uniref:Polysaccharide deacetylase n=1 Tax=Purpureocillium lavendulum TaxID=1247861 RepID=A0AB34G1I4_9HYPO|nr:polysaccharide deacetylase [Purpureocillium lavendulum]